MHRNENAECQKQNLDFQSEKSYAVKVIFPEKNAAREDADRIRLGKMLDRLIRISEEKRSGK